MEILQSIVLITACVAFCEGVPQALLESSPDTSVPVCPDIPLVFTCHATELGALNWFRDGAQIFSIEVDGSISLDDLPDGLQVVDTNFQPTNTTSTDFNSTLTVDNATLVGGSEICCGQTASLFADCAGVTLLATSAPTITSIREETVKSVNVTLEGPAEGSDCVEDYIIQYEGRNVSTGGTLSVVIEDAVLCSVAPVTFNVTAVLRGGSLIDGNESDFTLTGETLDIVTIMVNTSNARVINATTGELTVEWVEPGNDCGCNCTSTYIVRTNGNDIGTTDCAEGETTVQLQICEEHSLTIVPVLNHGITVESSSSNVAPVLIEFLAPNIAERNCTSENGSATVTVKLSELEIDNLRMLDPNAMIEVVYGDMMEIYTAEQLVTMNYQLTANLNSTEEITIRLTFISGSCNVSLPSITVQCEEPPSPRGGGNDDDSEIVRIIMIAVAAILVGTGTVTATATGAVDVDAWWKQKKQNASLNQVTLLKELKEVERDWKPLGECLGVSPSQLDEIAKQGSTASKQGYAAAMQESTTSEHMREMLNVWIRNHVGHPTWGEVVEGLGKLNHYHLAESLKRRYTPGSLKWWHILIIVCGVLLLLASVILFIVVVVGLADDIDADVGQDLAILFGFSCLVTVLAIVCWVILLIWIRKWITGQTLCENCNKESWCVCCMRKPKTTPEEFPMDDETDEHYGKLQRPGVVSPSSELLVDQSTYATLDMGDADVTTGQQEYAVTLHGTKPQAVLNISDPNYGHLNEGEAAQPEYDVAQHGRPKPKRGVPEVPGRGPDAGYGHLDQATRTKEYEEVSQAPRYKPRDSGRRQ